MKKKLHRSSGPASGEGGRGRRDSNDSASGGARNGAGSGRDGAPPPSRAKAITMRVLAVLIGLVVALAAAEIILRVLGIPQPMISRLNLQQEGGAVYHCYPSNPNGEFQPLPDVHTGQWKLFTSEVRNRQIGLDELARTPWCVEYRTSRLGGWHIRDRQYAEPPPAGTLRLAGIGDSFAMGEGVPLDKTLFKRLESTLGAGYEVVNHGVADRDTRQELQILQSAVASLHYTRALVVFIPNDIDLTSDLRARQDQIVDLIVLRSEEFERHESGAWYAGSLRIFQLAGSYFERKRITRQTLQWYLDCYDPPSNPQGLKSLAGYFRTMANLPDCRVALVVYPLMEGLEGPYPLERVHQTVMELARQANLPALDLAPFFAGQKTTDLQVHPTDHHPNGRAHAIAAAAIADWLRKDVRGFLDRPAAATTAPAGTIVD